METNRIGNGQTTSLLLKIVLGTAATLLGGWNVYLGKAIITQDRWRAATDATRYTTADAKVDQEKSADVHMRLLDAIRTVERSVDTKADKTLVTANTIALNKIVADVAYTRKATDSIEQALSEIRNAQK
jgi:hypothetical protein